MASENCERFGPRARVVFDEMVKIIQPTLPGPHHRRAREIHDEGWRDLRLAHVREQYIQHLRRRIGHHLEVDTTVYRQRGIHMREAVVSVVSTSDRVWKDLDVLELLRKLDAAMAEDRTTSEVISKE